MQFRTVWDIIAEVNASGYCIVPEEALKVLFPNINAINAFGSQHRWAWGFYQTSFVSDEICGAAIFAKDVAAFPRQEEWPDDAIREIP